MKEKVQNIGMVKGIWLEFAIAAKSMREDTGLTQEQLGQKLLPIATEEKVDAWESGRKHIPILQFFFICFICGFTSGKSIKSTINKHHSNKK
ncbi:helix-turn-helix domain-containing protein [Pseudoalteromonas luteoviolacea]|uniref:helix-turn-helix domain-containing protein n=1 Tax=Pseudoalteromonas luteoviolacea TaxID=43657 RepID=UPI001F242BED|nr:helix-turn-helix domain-containing protein [Pseudoalteromonas luteoviolacea]MCF6439842.1 helix-turn-helix domain-containing protein [Pseudoalteromonas luteoviolacea]